MVPNRGRPIKAGPLDIVMRNCTIIPGQDGLNALAGKKLTVYSFEPLFVLSRLVNDDRRLVKIDKEWFTTKYFIRV